MMQALLDLETEESVPNGNSDDHDDDDRLDALQDDRGDREDEEENEGADSATDKSKIFYQGKC